MKFSIKKSFNLGRSLFRLPLADKFTVNDESNNERFTAKGNKLKLGVYDSSEKLLATLSETSKRVIGRRGWHYSIEVNGNTVCEVIHKTKAIGIGIEITGLPWVLDYDNITADHTLRHGDDVIMTITDKVAFLGESYDVEVFDAENELICVAIVLAIDCIKG